MVAGRVTVAELPVGFSPGTENRFLKVRPSSVEISDKRGDAAVVAGAFICLVVALVRVTG
jgi:hypothetical protein